MKSEILLDIVTNLRNLATSLEASAATMLMDAEKDMPTPAVEQTKQQVVKAVTLEEVRAILAEKSMAGFTYAIRELLEKHGASKLSQIDPDNYAELFADAEALN